MALIDQGANGSLIAKDMLFVKSPLPPQFVSVIGAGDHTSNDCPIGSGIGKAISNNGPCLVFVHEAAHFPEQEHSIFSGVQLEDYGCDVNDKSIRFGGGQKLTTPDGHIFPLAIKDGLCYLPMQPPTQDELDDPNMPHVILTSNSIWDPSKYSDLDNIQGRLTTLQDSESPNDCLEYTTTGEIVPLNASFVDSTNPVSKSKY